MSGGLVIDVITCKTCFLEERKHAHCHSWR